MVNTIPGVFSPLDDFTTGKPAQIEYSVRVSPRAKRVTLKISPPDGLVVVIPRAFKKDKVPAIVEDRRHWIERALSKVLPAGISKEGALPPGSFFFALPGKSFGLAGDDILLHLRALAEDHLVPWAWKVANETGLRPERFSIRNQKSLWGSCSSKNRINLNQKLLFLEPHLVRYVVLHELCHLEHRNHSARFWTSLRDLDPFCCAHRRELRAAQWAVPSWAY
ncbi:MAG: SprT family zinc-dependent metalloprotease [Thermovirgaceae bacterium]|nr:SprT family zinc-dependent metalloprotease [Thermovirgaceae bacterium]